MRKFVWAFALALLVATPVLADDDDYYDDDDRIWYAPEVTGEQDRVYLRHFLYIYNLRGDKRDVYDEYGFTPHRIRSNSGGQVKEQWIYYELGISFVFSQCGDLLETHKADVEHRRSWAYQRPVAGYREDIHCDYCDD